MQRDEYIEANRKHWNEAAGVHARGHDAAFLKRLEAPDFTTFDNVEMRLFGEIGLQGKSVIQLACNNGREIISVKKAGAGRCVGIDISDEFVEQARGFARRAGVDVEFVRCSVYELSHDLDGQFDVVYITIGALGWMPDMDEFFALVARLLKPGGTLFLYEMHPILNMFEEERGVVPIASYFRTEAFADEAQPDYLHPDQTVHSVSYWFPHKLSDIIGGCLRHGLALSHFEEYGHDLSNVYSTFEQMENKLPLSFSLLARKAGARA